jgi:LL-diaminopimelate aminotransferase
VDIAYLCSPNNPTGAVASRAALEEWVAWARANDCVLIFDAAYDAFIQDPALPRSIYEIDGARECAIEMRSFSKRAGFTGVRCAYTVVPKELTGLAPDGSRVPFNALWARRHSTKFNGVSYPVQRAAEALYSVEGKTQIKKLVEHYMGTATLLKAACEEAGLRVYGGVHSPYVWVQCPEGISSWEMFDKMLEDAQVVITPGAGFGAAGEGYFRISAFNSRENVEEVGRRIATVFGGGRGS